MAFPVAFNAPCYSRVTLRSDAQRSLAIPCHFACSRINVLQPSLNRAGGRYGTSVVISTSRSKPSLHRQPCSGIICSSAATTPAGTDQWPFRVVLRLSWSRALADTVAGLQSLHQTLQRKILLSSELCLRGGMLSTSTSTCELPHSPELMYRTGYCTHNNNSTPSCQIDTACMIALPIDLILVCTADTTSRS